MRRNGFGADWVSRPPRARVEDLKVIPSTMTIVRLFSLCSSSAAAAVGLVLSRPFYLPPVLLKLHWL